MTADGGITPKQHDGWMWDLTVPGNNDHDFYVLAGNLGQPGNSQHPYDVVAGDTSVLVHNANCWTATDKALDKIHDTYGPRVGQGVEWMMGRYNEGATGHALNGIGTDATATARYLAQPRVWSHIDSTSGNWVTYDSSNQILIIRTAQDIHAYNYTSEQWETNVGVRYVDPAAGVTPPAWP